MSVVQFTSAQLAEQAFAAAHRCASGSAVALSSRSCCWLGESGKDGPESSLSSAGSLSDQEEGCDDDDEWDEDEGGELVDERFLDPESPLGRAIEIIGRARNLSSVPAQFVHRLDPDWLARADGFAEHCCDRLWTLEALRGSDCLGTYSTRLSDGTLDYYLGFHGERAEDAIPYHDLHAWIQQHEGSSSGEATAVTAAAVEEILTPTPRPGPPPRLGRPSTSSRGSQFFEASAALLTQMRAPPSAVSARMPTPRRRPPVSTPPAVDTGDDDDSRSPASMPESARQELYELYQYTSNGSRARHASSGGGGDRATETDSLASGLQQIDLDPLRLVNIMEPSPGGQEEEHEAARELWYEEEEIVEEEEEDELAEQDLHEHLQRCDDIEAEAAERERDQSEQARRQRSGGPVGR
ncbi:hypothetical protein C6P46_002670 [Rhodotorula mucilaginosa]|uniref:Uncharacterized protein n=1 Tax=Rhodotorula mucilaginosa TaxID=5537 RepID=A0A9P6WAK7_RHOMI|nr:hypothetical protein C6P46_002670 [Rhodotorula mucilaginosa]TKA55230.1 hypothetical protein B0A53_02200 [Rhodotorula sp. CCFEE 5036]